MRSLAHPAGDGARGPLLAQVIGAAIAIGVLVAPSAALAQGGPEPVVGGGSFNTAPPLEPGRYSDTIVPRESVYYRVELQKGQRLRVEALFDKSGFSVHPSEPGFESGIAGLFEYVALYTPLRQPATLSNLATGGGQRVARGRAKTRLVLGFEELLDGSYTGLEFFSPGSYYLRLGADDPVFDARPVEIPTEIRIELEGEPQQSSPEFEPEPAPEATDEIGTEDGAAPEQPTDQSEGPESGAPGELELTGDGDGDETGVGSLIAIGAFALVGGGAIGFAGARTFSRRR